MFSPNDFPLVEVRVLVTVLSQPNSNRFTAAGPSRKQPPSASGLVKAEERTSGRQQRIYGQPGEPTAHHLNHESQRQKSGHPLRECRGTSSTQSESRMTMLDGLRLARNKNGFPHRTHTKRGMSTHKITRLHPTPSSQ